VKVERRRVAPRVESRLEHEIELNRPQRSCGVVRNRDLEQLFNEGSPFIGKRTARDAHEVDVAPRAEAAERGRAAQIGAHEIIADNTLDELDSRIQLRADLGGDHAVATASASRRLRQ
jgi:hypothetical protein